MGDKSKDYNDFCQVVELMKKKEHLTEDGLGFFLILKARMNRERYFRLISLDAILPYYLF